MVFMKEEKKYTIIKKRKHTKRGKNQILQAQPSISSRSRGLVTPRIDEDSDLNFLKRGPIPEERIFFPSASSEAKSSGSSKGT